MENHQPEKNDLEELKDLYLFEEVHKFIRKSAGLTLALAYLVLLLSSMGYLYLLYNAFEINILQLVTFEDVLATPIKNPYMIFTFFWLFLIFYVADVGNRYRARLKEKYANGTAPLFPRIISAVFWAPKKRKANIRATFTVIVLALVAYVFVFSLNEARHIKEGRGSQVAITFADEADILETTLLGTTTNFVLTYDDSSGESAVYYIEAIKSIKKRQTKEIDTVTEPGDAKDKGEKPAVGEGQEESDQTDDIDTGK